MKIWLDVSDGTTVFNNMCGCTVMGVVKDGVAILLDESKELSRGDTFTITENPFEDGRPATPWLNQPEVVKDLVEEYKRKCVDHIERVMRSDRMWERMERRLEELLPGGTSEKAEWEKMFDREK